MCILLGIAPNAAAQSEPFTRVIAPSNAGLTIQSSGATLTVNLADPSGLNISALKSQLGNKATSINTSPDGKRYTITLSKPYRVRQFVSSKGAGFDVMEETGPSVLPKTAPLPEKNTEPLPAEAQKAKAPAAKPIEETKKHKAPVSSTPPLTATAEQVTSPAIPPLQKREAADGITPPPPKPEPTKIAPKETEKTPAPSVQETNTAPAATEQPPAPAKAPNDTSEQTAIKAEGPQPPQEQPPVTKQEEEKTERPNEDKKPSPAMSMTALPLPKEALEPENKPIVAAKIEQAVATPQEATSPPKQTITEPPKETVDLLVGVAPKGKGVDITFPWESRVATALYQRDRDWWLIFAAPSRIDMQQFRSVLPNNITVPEPYTLQGHTVLHFVTDGKSSLSASQTSGSYAWNISIEPGHTSTPKAYALEPMPDAPKPYVAVRAFDVASPIGFTDPKYKDRLMVIPSYESSKALITPYQNPDFRTVIANQGIVLHIENESVTATKGRDGIRFSAPEGLHLSRDIPALPMESAAEADTVPNIMFPYARWRTTPEAFASTRIERTQALANASKENKPKALLDLATLYLGQGMSEEALSLINQLRDRFPEYYNTNEVALLRAASNFMIFRMGDAATDIMAPEIANNPETVLWKDAISLFVPQILAPVAPENEEVPTEEKKAEAQPVPTLVAPEPRFDYLAYNRNFIRYYPPQIRQKLAIIAADNFVAQKEYSKAARTMDILNRDGLLMPIRHYAEFLLGRIAADSGKPAEAIKLWKPLSTQYDDMFIHARANFSLATLEYSEGKRSIEDTIKTLERLRIVWRGDTLEQNLLSYLGQLYFEKGDYAGALRTWKDYVLEYGASPDGLSISNKMSELFERLYGEEALADTMDPLRSLALFYEFRELSPIGARGDAIIQKLADRLAKFDLLDKAADLLEHQVKFRVQGEERAGIGAQLALVHLLNKKPEKALEALEISGYGVASPALASERNRLAAMALSKLNKSDISLEMLAADRSPQGQLLRLEILWDEQDWANVINVAEDMLSARTNIAAPLTSQETDTLLKLALAYSFESDLTQLKYLREYYAPLMKQSPYKDIFEHITNDTAILDPEDFEMVAKQISSTESFMKHFKDKIAEGRLSSALEPESKPTATEEKQSRSERNSQLVPEAQDNTLDNKEDEQSEDTSTENPASAAKQRAPVEVTPENEKVPEEKEGEDQSGNTQETPEATEKN